MCRFSEMTAEEERDKAIQQSQYNLNQASFSLFSICVVTILATSSPISQQSIAIDAIHVTLGPLASERSRS